MTKCPFCSEMVPQAAAVCARCGRGVSKEALVLRALLMFAVSGAMALVFIVLLVLAVVAAAQ